VDGPNRRHSLYAGITSDDGRYPAAARPALIDPTPLATAPQHVTWDAALDPDLVPLIVESDRPEDARKLALLEEKYAKRHANTIPNRLRRQQVVDMTEEVPEIHPEPYPAPPKQVKKSISSLFHGNSKGWPAYSDTMLLTIFTQSAPRQTSDQPRAAWWCLHLT
jgi:hypothetical protein